MEGERGKEREGSREREETDFPNVMFCVLLFQDLHLMKTIKPLFLFHVFQYSIYFPLGNKGGFNLHLFFVHFNSYLYYC
jgi:hypothetical protein